MFFKFYTVIINCFKEDKIGKYITNNFSRSNLSVISEDVLNQFHKKLDELRSTFIKKRVLTEKKYCDKLSDERLVELGFGKSDSNALLKKYGLA